MDIWEWTKVGTAVSAAVTVAFGGNWFAGKLMDVTYPREQAYVVEGAAPVDLAALQRSWPSGFGKPGDPDRLLGFMGKIQRTAPPVALEPAVRAPARPVDLPTLLASADVEAGRRTAQVCRSCHTLEAGGANRVGPNLWGIVGQRLAAQPGFTYSNALASHGGTWTFEALDRYLASPARAIPGNKMPFAGIHNPQTRAGLLAFLATLSATPTPFPPGQARVSDEGASAALR